MNNAKIPKHGVAPRYTATSTVTFMSSHFCSICQDVDDNDDLLSISPSRSLNNKNNPQHCRRYQFGLFVDV